MATEVSANFQDPSGGPINAYYRAQDQRMSMMQKASALEQQKLAMKQQELMNAQLEQKRIEWDVQAPVRQAEQQQKMAEYGSSLAIHKKAADLRTSFAVDQVAMAEDLQNTADMALTEGGNKDWMSLYDGYSELRAKWNKYELIPEGKLFLAEVDQRRVDAMEQHQIEQKANMFRMKQANRPVIGPVTAEDVAQYRRNTGDITDIPIGTVMSIQRDPETFEVVSMGRPVNARPSSEEAGEKAGAEQEAKDIANETSDYMKSVDANALQAVDQKVTIDNVLGLLQSKKANTGFAQSQLNLVRSGMQKMGLGDPEQLKNDQYVVSNLRMLRLELARTVMKGGGAISDAERNLLALATANEDYSPEANIAILSGMRKMIERDETLGRMKMQMEAGGVKRKDIALRLKQWKLDNPVSGIEGIDDMLQDSKTANSIDEFQALAKAGAKSITFNGKTYKREQKQK